MCNLVTNFPAVSNFISRCDFKKKIFLLNFKMEVFPCLVEGKYNLLDVSAVFYVNVFHLLPSRTIMKREPWLSLIEAFYAVNLCMPHFLGNEYEVTQPPFGVSCNIQ